MSGITFKNFLAFTEMDGEVSDEQITEIFGVFQNNKKLDALKAKRDQLKTAGKAKSDELDAALKNFGSGGKQNGKNVISDDDLEAALSSSDRKMLSRQDKLKDADAAMIRKKLGIAEAVKVKEPGWYVVDHMDKPVEGPMQERGAKARADEMNAEHKSKHGKGDIEAFSAEYYTDYQIRRMNEAKKTVEKNPEIKAYVEKMADGLSPKRLARMTATKFELPIEDVEVMIKRWGHYMP